jgi:hypothetical protein
VAKYLVRRRRPPSQNWRTFLKNHMQSLVSADFFVVPTITFRLLFVFVILSHNRQRPIHLAITASPTSEWTTRQLLEAFPFLRDRDRLYILKTRSNGFPSNVTLLLPVAFLTRAPVPFLHVADFKGVRHGWDLRDTQTCSLSRRRILLRRLRCYTSSEPVQPRRLNQPSVSGHAEP